MISTAPAVSFEARVEGFPTGLVGTVGVQILDNIGGVTVARVTAGIIEDPAGSGSYTATLTSPATAGMYSVFWDTGVISPSTTAAEDLTVTSTVTVAVSGRPTEPLVLWVGDRNPSLTETITTGGVPVDLTGATVAFKMRPVGGASVALTGTTVVVSALAGMVRFDWGASDLATVGQYLVWWEVTVAGKRQDMAEALIEVRDHALGVTSLCELADVKLALKHTSTETGRDAEIQQDIIDASRAIRVWTDREFAPTVTAATRRFQVTSRHVSLAPYDLRAATSVALNPEFGSPIALTPPLDYVLRPIQPLFGVYDTLEISVLRLFGMYGPTAAGFGYALLDITGDWGFATVPADVKRACVITVMSWLDRPVNAYAATDFDVSGRALLADSAAGLSIPYAARRLLGPYQRGPYV